MADATLIRVTRADMPALLLAASETARRSEQRFLRATGIRLLSLLLAAVSGAFAGHLAPPDPIAIVAVFAFVLAMVTETFLLIDKPEQLWYEGRAAAESVKTLTWRYCVGGLPFGIDEPHADALFLSRLREILTDLRETRLVPPTDSGPQVTPAMRALRAAAAPTRRAAYRDDRITSQLTWYTTRARWNASRARLLRTAALLLELAGVILGLVAVAGVTKFEGLGIAAAAGAGVAAWMQTKQHETLTKAYFVTARELAALRTDWETARDEKEWAAFVDQAEEAISREHTLWRASRSIR